MLVYKLVHNDQKLFICWLTGQRQGGRVLISANCLLCGDLRLPLVPCQDRHLQASTPLPLLPCSGSQHPPVTLRALPRAAVAGWGGQGSARPSLPPHAGCLGVPAGLRNPDLGEGGPGLTLPLSAQPQACRSPQGCCKLQGEDSSGCPAHRAGN